MKRTLLIGSAALCMGFAMAACDSSNNPSHQQQAGQSDQSPAWKLVLQSKCAAASAAEQCVGFYGFTVSADGKFQVGPGPSGQLLNGILSAEENKALQDAYLSAAPSAQVLSANPSVCKASTDSSQDGATSTIQLIRQGSEKALVTTESTQLCFQSANFDAAQALHDEIWQLANKYYTLPFPDACADAAKQLEDLYPALQACKTDADCTYVGLDFQPINPSANLFVTTQSGTKAQPITVANLNLLIPNEARLSNAADSAASSCDGTVMYPVDGFYPNNVAPVCVQNLCRVPQAAASTATN
jgi:hypothetical protein